MAEIPSCFLDRLRFSMLIVLLMVASNSIATYSPHGFDVALKWSPQPQFAGYYAALHKGLYRDVGLHAYVSGAKPVEPTLTGQVDYAMSNTETLLQRSSHASLVALAAAFQQAPTILLTQESSATRTFEDLRGKRMMLHDGSLTTEWPMMLETIGHYASGSFLLLEAKEDIRLVFPRRGHINHMNIEPWERIQDTFQVQEPLQDDRTSESFPYRNMPKQTAYKFIEHYRSAIIAALVLGFVLAMLIYIFRLRSTLRARTRELREIIRHAEAEARTDPLTTLPNRRAFLEALTRDLARRERSNISVAVIIIDIDHFKAVNDHYGHFAGDTALRTVAAVLSAQIRSGDVVARIGGEEFALACVDADKEEMRHLAERLRTAVATRAVHYADLRFNITISLGLAFHEPGESLEKLLKRADGALYQAKENGRNESCEAPMSAASAASAGI